MRLNETEIKVSPLLRTPDEAQCGHHVAKQNHNEATLAHRLRVNGVPNEATLASFPASR